MQYLIIWSGNLAEEIPWYLRRSQGGWGFFAVVLILFHFFGPFFFLLMKDLKRRPDKLMSIAAFILFMHLIDSIWLVLPSQFLNPLMTSENRIYVPWGQVLLSLAAAVGIGGVWLWFFAGRLMSAPVVPFNDPAAEHIAFEHAGVARPRSLTPMEHSPDPRPARTSPRKPRPPGTATTTSTATPISAASSGSPSS